MSKPNKFRSVNKENTDTQPNDAENKMIPSDSSAIKPIVFEDADEHESSSYLSKAGTFLGECCGKVTACTTSAASTTWECCKSSVQWTCNGIKAIPSYCVIRWDTGDGKDEIDETVPTKSAAKIESVKEESVKAAVKPVEGKTREAVTPIADGKPAFSFVSLVSFVKSLCTAWLNFLPQRTPKTHEEHKEDQYDEDELAPSRWWSIGIKTAAVSVAVLILAGGYFAAKPLFNVPTEMADTQTVEPIDPSSLAQAETVPTGEPSVWAAPVVAAVPEPVPFGFPSPPQQSENTFATPAQGSPFDNDLFAAQTPPVAPAFHDAAPSIARDSFGAAVQHGVADNTTSPVRTALSPLAPLESVQSAHTQPQLQPLVALDSSRSPSTNTPTAFAAAPAAAPASAFAPFAANYDNTASPVFNQAPTPPTVTTLPHTAIGQPIVIVEPVREIVPQIPPSGTVQKVPPPVFEMSTVENPPLIHAMNTEAPPAIPRDVPMGNSPPVVVVPAAASVAEFSSPQIMSAEAQPIDRQLWEQVHELRRRAEAEPMPLRLEAQAATTEPALRFTPKNAAPSAIDDNLLARGAVNSFEGLLPTPNSQEIATLLPALANAPRPVLAELAPAYRNNTTNQLGQPASEGGRTFQSRINSEVTRSPSATETYTVQQGDTYMTISDRFYGTSLLYTALAQHNQRLGIGWRPAEGVVIEIPTAEFLRMHYGAAMNRQERRLEAQRSGVRYIVQEGDTIFRLATDRLQDSTRWREIYAMNADRLQDVRDLQPGMEILLPVLETARRN